MNSNTAHAIDGFALQAVFEDVFYGAGVDFVFSGHVHAYERSCRVYKNACNSEGPYYITIGDGGNREGLAAVWQTPQPAWSVFRQASYGHGELDVVNATHMHWTWHQNPDLEPEIADELWVVKGQQVAQGPNGGVTGIPTFKPGHNGDYCLSTIYSDSKFPGLGAFPPLASFIYI